MEEAGYREASFQLPEAASTLADHVDPLYTDIFWISVVFFVGIVGCMTWFAWKFRRRAGVDSKPPGHHTALELFWTFSPLLLLVYMFHEGFEGFMFMSVPPEDSINVRVTAFKWGWRFEQPNGKVDSEALVVPEHKPVRLIMRSIPLSDRPADGAVLHSFYVPAFRVKRDVVPGMLTSLWFEATKQGEYQVYCTEYCGTGHSRMLSKVRVLSSTAYEEYLNAGVAPPDDCIEQEDPFVCWGTQLFASNGCVACHNVEAGQGNSVGPNLHGVAGTEQPIMGGPAVVATLDYLRESIHEPQAKIVEGYGNAAMPSFASLHELEIDALASYVASLSDSGADIINQVEEANPLE